MQIFFFTRFIFTISLIGVLYSSCTTIRQIDLKKIIAYSSVAHMNFALIGLFSINIYSLSGSVFLMLSHGIVSGALFLCVGILYDRYHTRLLKYYGGLVQYMPLFSFFFLLFTMANIAFPGTTSFLGEFLIIIGLFQSNIFITFFMSFSVILSACYAVWLYNRVVYGPLKKKFISFFSDLNKREFFILLPLGFLTIFCGIYPFFIFDIFYNDLFFLIENNYIHCKKVNLDLFFFNKQEKFDFPLEFKKSSAYIEEKVCFLKSNNSLVASFK